MPPHWAHNLLGTCMSLRSGEQVLVLVDEPLRAAGEALVAVARQMNAGGVTIQAIALDGRPLAVVSGGLLREVQSADVIVSLLSRLDLEREVSSLRAAVSAFRQAGRGRWAFGAYIDEEVLNCELNADYREVARIAGELAARLEGVDKVHLRSRAGTDLRFRLGGRPIHQDTGLFREPGTFGNLPAGEVFVAPLEESAEGQLVVDLSLGDLVLTEPLTLTFRGGRVVAVAGGPAAGTLERRISGSPWASVIGEFGLGANPKARIRGRVTTDEKVLGTAHVALGGNRQFGGLNPADSHYDCVLDAPEVWLDGRIM